MTVRDSLKSELRTEIGSLVGKRSVRRVYLPAVRHPVARAVSSETLSQTEIDALLGGSGPAVQPNPIVQRGGTAEVQVYDFRSPHRISKERLRTLVAMYERLVKSLEGWLMGRARAHLEMRLQSVETVQLRRVQAFAPHSLCFLHPRHSRQRGDSRESSIWGMTSPTSSSIASSAAAVSRPSRIAGLPRSSGWRFGEVSNALRRC